MKKTLEAIITDKGNISSARVINVLGAITGTVLLIYHGIWLEKLDSDVFMVYMAYCGGVYGVGKMIDRKYGGDDDRYSNENIDRYEARGNSDDEYSASRTRDH